MREGEINYSSSLCGLFGLVRPGSFLPVEELKMRIKYCFTWWADSAGEAMDKVDMWGVVGTLVGSAESQESAST